MSPVRDAYHALLRGENLTNDNARAAFSAIMDGGVEDALIGGFLTALKLHGERAEDLAAGAQVLRERATPIPLSEDMRSQLVDTCGTGGDGAHTYNISTAAALIAAGAGARVAKHGGRAASSQSGSADVLAALGAPLDAPPERVSQALEQAGVAFLFAQTYHAAMRHVAPARKALGTRTVFNLLGPLSNPAAAPRQVLGVAAPELVDLMANALLALGVQKAWVVHGDDGLDELTTTARTHVAEVSDGDVKRFTLDPEDAGLPRARLEDIRGAAPEYNAAALRALLAGERSAFRDIAVLNAAAVLVVAGNADDIQAGAQLAQQSIDTGAARRALESMIALTQPEASP